MASDLPIFPGSGFFKGENLQIANKAIGKLNSLGNMSGAGGIHVSMSDAGTIIEAPPGQSIEPPWIGVIVANGPQGLPKDKNFTDARYWVQRLIYSESGKGTTTVGSPYQFYKKQQPTNPPGGTPVTSNPVVLPDAIVPVFNVAEHYTTGIYASPAESHFLQTGLIVEVTPRLFLPHTSGNSYIVYTMFVYPPVALFKPYANTTRPGVYKAHTWISTTTPFDVTVTTAPAESDLGHAATDMVYLINTREVGKSIADPTQWDFVFVGYTPTVVTARYLTQATDKTPTYIFDGVQGENCS